MNLNPIIARMKADPNFAQFLVPLEEDHDFRDATYFLREDGTFIFSEGYYHQIEKPRPERNVISHVVYAPRDPEHPLPDYTHKTLFGQDFDNVTKDIMSTQPLDKFYPLQLQEYIRIDPSQENIPRPSYARYKSLIPVNSLLGSFPHRHSLRTIMERAEEDKAARNIKIVSEHTAELLGIDLSRLGISGSLCLGNYSSPHDLDYVIYGTAADVRRMVYFMRRLTDREEKRKVYEFGKYWLIRFWEWAGKVKFMVCPFFSYLDPEEAPLRNFDCEELGAAQVEATISDDTHGAFNPSLLRLEKVKLNGKDYPDLAQLILYHGGERGDWREGCRIRGWGNQVRIRTYSFQDGKRKPEDAFEALLVNNLGQVEKI